jgi:hypothetical protein
MPSEDLGDVASAEEFDVAALSDEEVKSLHKDVLLGILRGMKEFVAREANDPEKTDIPADLDEKLDDDIAALEDPSIADDALASIEAAWQPVLSFFLDSDMYHPDQELDTDEVNIEDVVPGGEDAEAVAQADVEVPPTAGALPPEENLPGVEQGEVQNTLPQPPMGVNPTEVEQEQI